MRRLDQQEKYQFHAMMQAGFSQIHIIKAH